MASSGFSESFAAVVRRHRERLGLSQERSPKKQRFPDLRRAVGEGKRKPTIKVAEKVAVALGRPLSRLIAEAEARPNRPRVRGR
jgi:ribosome-binding protein aMBF1 (putative translation factor)